MGLRFLYVGEGDRSVFVPVFLPGFFPCRNPGCCLECWNQNFQPVLALFSSAEISFHWRGGKTCLELSPVPFTFVCKKRECQFSVEGVKNVNMSELENFRHCLPTSACVFTQLVFDSSGCSS